MYGYLWCLLLFAFLWSSPCIAQIQVQTDEGNSVTIGPGGINVQDPHHGTVLNISPTGVTGVTGAGTQSKKVNISTHSKRTGQSGTAVSVQRTGRTATQQAVGGSSQGTSLQAQVEQIELAVTGTAQKNLPLSARVEKLEIDNLGARGSGPLKARIEALAKSLGVTRPSPSGLNVTDINITPGGLSVTSRGHGSQSVTTQAQVTSGLNTGSDCLLIDSDSRQGTYNLKGGSVIINSNNCKLRLLGHCSKLVVNGNNNQVYGEQVDSILVNGNSNTVTWPAAQNPTVLDNGNHNIVGGR
jgi:hypothetical protein